MEDLIRGLKWLAEKGRDGALDLRSAAIEDDELDTAIDEAAGWLTDIADGTLRA